MWLNRVKKEDAERLKEEYESLLRGLKRRRENNSADSVGGPDTMTTSRDDSQNTQERQGIVSSSTADKEATSGSDGTEKNQTGKGSESTNVNSAGSSSSSSASSASSSSDLQGNKGPSNEVGARGAAGDRGTNATSRHRGGLLAAETLDLLATPLLPDDALMEQVDHDKGCTGQPSVLSPLQRLACGVFPYLNTYRQLSAEAECPSSCHRQSGGIQFDSPDCAPCPHGSSHVQPLVFSWFP